MTPKGPRARLFSATIVTLILLVVASTIVALQQRRTNRLLEELDSLRAATAERSHRRGEARIPAKERGAADRAERDGAGLGSAGLRDILATPDPMNRIRALLAYVDGLAPEDLPAALAEARRSVPEWDPEGRMLTHMLLTRWAQVDPDAAFASLGDLDFKRKGGDPNSILASLAAKDPKRAAAWLSDPDSDLVHYPWMGRFLAGTIAKEWVRQDPEAAMAWAEGLPENQRAGAYTGVLGSLAARDPALAAGIATDLEPGESRAGIMGEIAKGWARSSPSEALAWAQTLEGAEQRGAMRQALGTWAQSSPAEAAQFVDTLGEVEGADPYLTTVAATWAPQAPAEAAAWLEQHAEGDGKNEAMGHVMWNWTTRDPEAAGQWLSEQAPGPSRDAGIGGLAKASFEFDPAAAVSWANAMENEERRATSVQIGLRTWMERDPEAAQRWAEENGVTVPAGGK